LRKLTFTVINDLTYDQRMQRICSSLTNAGYKVTLIGRQLPGSLPLRQQPFQQKRLTCFFSKGRLMYIEFNLRLLFYLLLISTDCYCAIDLDTILPNYVASAVRKKKRVYDAHELFTELKEIVTRPAIHKIWLQVERFALPRYQHGYTVNEFIANEFLTKYGVHYSVVRNLPLLTAAQAPAPNADPFIIYQGAVNEGRSFETLIPAMKFVNAKLVICGNGNFFTQTKRLIKNEGVEAKVELRGMVTPDDLKAITPTAYAAVMLFEGIGLNQYQSLANRFFDYIMAGVPQVCVDYPQYKKLNDKYRIASLIADTQVETIANALNNLLNDTVYYNTIRKNCLVARTQLNWQNEEKVLLNFYEKLWLP
jgi:glycosyltransferase involved in cell wall biosynthesis